jgi:hypothetical protein
MSLGNAGAVERERRSGSKSGKFKMKNTKSTKKGVEEGMSSRDRIKSIKEVGVVIITISMKAQLEERRPQKLKNQDRAVQDTIIEADLAKVMEGSGAPQLQKLTQP